jgi:hypothetical protein
MGFSPCGMLLGNPQRERDFFPRTVQPLMKRPALTKLNSMPSFLIALK